NCFCSISIDFGNGTALKTWDYFPPPFTKNSISLESQCDRLKTFHIADALVNLKRETIWFWSGLACDNLWAGQPEVIFRKQTHGLVNLRLVGKVLLLRNRLPALRIDREHPVLRIGTSLEELPCQYITRCSSMQHCATRLDDHQLLCNTVSSSLKLLLKPLLAKDCFCLFASNLGSSIYLNGETRLDVWILFVQKHAMFENERQKLDIFIEVEHFDLVDVPSTANRFFFCSKIFTGKYLQIIHAEMISLEQ